MELKTLVGYYQKSLERSKLKRLLFGVIISSIETTGGWLDLYGLLLDEDKLKKLCIKMIQNSESFDCLLRLYLSLPEGKLKETTFKKVVKYACTQEELFDLYGKIPDGKIKEDVLKKIIRKASKLDILLILYEKPLENKKAIINRITNIADKDRRAWLDVYRKSPAKSELEDVSFKKIVRLSPTFKEWDDNSSMSQAGSRLNALSLDKMLELADDMSELLQTYHKVSTKEAKKILLEKIVKLAGSNLSTLKKIGLG
jgi:dsDNA-binding SOS-regulon protein